MNTLVSLPILAAVPTTAPAMLPDAEQAADPIFAAIDAYRTADAACAARAPPPQARDALPSSDEYRPESRIP